MKQPNPLLEALGVEVDPLGHQHNERLLQRPSINVQKPFCSDRWHSLNLSLYSMHLCNLDLKCNKGWYISTAILGNCSFALHELLQA